MKKFLVFGVSSIFLIFMINLISAVRINEVAPKTPEFVEIYNLNSETLNLSEWQIKDESGSTDRIVCNNIPNCSLITSATYFVIIGQNTNISDITSENIYYFYVEDDIIAYYLNDDGDNITFFNSTFSTSFSYNSSSTDKSWQFCSNSWREAEPTPGQENSCGSEDSQDENGNSDNDGNGGGDNGEKPEIYLELEYNEEEIINGKEFEIEIEAYNLKEEDYDIKIFITFENNNNIISETYDEEDDKWKSSKYYVKKVFSGPGNKTKTLILRIDEDYKDFKGDGKIKARIKKSGASSFLEEFEDEIEILEKREEKEKVLKIDETKESGEVKESEKEPKTIQLNNPKNIKSYTVREYKSKTQYIKEYAIYGFALFCVFVIIYLLIKR